MSLNSALESLRELGGGRVIITVYADRTRDTNVGVVPKAPFSPWWTTTSKEDLERQISRCVEAVVAASKGPVEKEQFMLTALSNEVLSGPADPQWQLAKHIADTLNELTAMDPEAIHALLSFKVACNEQIAGHPSVIAEVGVDAGADVCRVGMLGLLNGLLQDARRLRIMWTSSDDPSTSKFSVITPETHPAIFS